MGINRDEWWTVYGVFPLGSRSFNNEKDAEEEFEKALNDPWSVSPTLVYSKVIKKRED